MKPGGGAYGDHVEPVTPLFQAVDQFDFLQGHTVGGEQIPMVWDDLSGANLVGELEGFTGRHVPDDVGAGTEEIGLVDRKERPISQMIFFFNANASSKFPFLSARVSQPRAGNWRFV